MSAWAKFPSSWVRPKGEQAGPLKTLLWSDHRTTGLAALVILIALSIRLNQSHKGLDRSLETESLEVAVTYDDLQSLTGYARATIAKALMLLEGMAAICIRREGRSNFYALPAIGINGGWCQLPQAHLMDSSSSQIKRLEKLPAKKVSLNAMKLYVVLLTWRAQRLNTTAMSYSTITKYTGIRREEIRQACSMLVALELAHTTKEEDARSQDDPSNRYVIRGLHKAA